MFHNTFTPILFLVIAVGLFYTYLSPGYAKITELGVEKSEYQEALNRVREIESVRDNLLTRYNSFSADNLSKLNTMLPDNIDNVRLVLDLSAIASKYNIAIQNIKISKTNNNVADDPFSDQMPHRITHNPVQISFAFDANYETFTRFMEEIERSLRLIDVSTISFHSTQDGSPYAFNVTFATYWLDK
jgi:hypothetical protein